MVRTEEASHITTRIPPIFLSNIQPFNGTHKARKIKVVINAEQFHFNGAENSRGICCVPLLYMTIVALMPKELIDKSGPPKQAPKAMTGMPILAIMRFETKSPTELPKANTVAPRTSSLMENIEHCHNFCRKDRDP